MKCQTPAELAKVARTRASSTAPVDHAVVHGELLLTPIQRWFFANKFADCEHWNQAISFSSSVPIDESRLKQALAQLQQHHDMLRCRYVLSGDGTSEWHQTIPKAEHSSAAELHVLEASTEAEVDAMLTDVHAQLRLSTGPVWRAALVRLDGEGERVVLVFHHLVIDAVSWRILEEDLVRCYAGLPLPSKTTSFMVWAKELCVHLDSQPQWKHAVSMLACDVRVDACERIEDRQEVVQSKLSRKTTSVLLGPASIAFCTRPQELMLAALAVAHCSWCGNNVLDVQMEGHGREPFGVDVDVSRTVGWFTVLWPVRLEVAMTEASGDASMWADAICCVKEQLRSVPKHVQQYGMDYGELPELLFNYLGQLGGQAESSSSSSSSGGGGFRLDMNHAVGESHGAANHATVKMALNSHVFDGELEVDWSFDKVEYRNETVQRFADIWIEALENVVGVGSDLSLQRWTPSDFPLCGLPQQAFDAAVARVPDDYTIDGMSKLTSLQSGLVAGTMANPTAYVVQSVTCVRGEFDVGQLQQAWEAASQAHDALRIRILVAGLSHPVQAVLAGAGLFIGWEVQQVASNGHSIEVQVRQIAAEDRCTKLPVRAGAAHASDSGGVIGCVTHHRDKPPQHIGWMVWCNSEE